MEYSKPKDNYKGQEKSEQNYYNVEKMPEKEDTKLPTFHQIFEDMPIKCGVISNANYFNGIVYFSSFDTHVYAINGETGELVWKFKTGGPITFCSPLVHKNRIYFGSNDEFFYCLDLAGTVLWKRHLGDVIASTALGIGENIFVSNGLGYFFCFN